MSKLLPIRLSHLLGYNGVGAIVRGPHSLMVVQDIRQWTDRQGNTASKLLPYVERVKVALDIKQQLREPPVVKELKNGQADGVCVPATRFPTWTRCLECGAMYRWPWRNDQSDYEPRCNKCPKKAKLEQVVWVLVHPNGYLADVPWHFLLHGNLQNPIQKACKLTDQLFLKYKPDGKRELSCKACGAKIRFNADERLPFGQGRMQPWTKDDVVQSIKTTEEDSSKLAQILSIDNDSRIYLPRTSSALVIPPESRVCKGTVVDLLCRNSGDRTRIDTAPNVLAKKAAIRTLATKYQRTITEIEIALSELDQGYPLYGKTITPGKMLEDEFKALLEILPDQQDDEDLVTHNHSLEWQKLVQETNPDSLLQYRLKAIQNLVQVDRLKEVKVFSGFSRPIDEDKDKNLIVPPDILGQSDWLPAIELYGEGIFIVLNEERLQSWERHPAVNARLDQLLPRFAQSGKETPNPLSSRFMLLHTLSHLLMRQIEAEGGYPAASLKERLYCTVAPESMAGILIYVAVPDIAGSLGGLAELAEPQQFQTIFIRALEHSNWCSLDPVCSEHEGQGPGLLNRAACHACTLVPEPACEYGNSLLDRGFIKSDSDSGLPSFFDWIE